MTYADFKIPVLSADMKRIGTVAEADGPFVRVSRGLLRRPYWIPTEYIAVATPAEVVLSVSSDQVDRFASVVNLPKPQPEDEAAAEERIAACRRRLLRN